MSIIVHQASSFKPWIKGDRINIKPLLLFNHGSWLNNKLKPLKSLKIHIRNWYQAAFCLSLAALICSQEDPG